MCKEKEIVKIPQAVINTMSDLEKIIYGISPCSSIKEACKEINTNKNAKNLIVYRGDNRKYEDLKDDGFAPRYQLPREKILNLIAILISNIKFRADFHQWLKYPCCRNINDLWHPFVSTGTLDSHLGTYDYTINLRDVYVYDFGSGVNKMQIVFKGERLEDSSIIGILIDHQEIVFCMNIPKMYINAK